MHVTRIVLAVMVASGAVAVDQPPEGYYAWIESPNAAPPKVKPPPYSHSHQPCPGMHGDKMALANNLCGDLNKGFIPLNPLGQKGYPFELIKNKTLEFFSKTLPILKADDTLPKVAQYIHHEPDPAKQHNTIKRTKREEASRHVVPGGRKFCDNQGGMMCMLYKALTGEALIGPTHAERRDDDEPEIRVIDTSLPPTPCPAKVDYATPVFARNHQGIWRYVVQIPYEGYFTQTIEVTTCVQSRCHYLDGGCLSSPRWTSLLVAEIFYPDTVLPLPASNTKWRDPVNPDETNGPPPVHDFQNYQQYLRKRAGGVAPSVTQAPTTAKKTTNCDGVDDIGCLQVRLYYDWFLVPGSCKCWRPDYFNRYIRRKNVTPDL